VNSSRDDPPLLTDEGFRSYGARVTELAAARPHDEALILVDVDATESSLSWAELETAANRTARFLDQHGIGPGETIVIAIPNSHEHVILALAAWKLGGCVMPLNSALPLTERREILELVQPQLVVAEWEDDDALRLNDLQGRDKLPSDPLPDRVPSPGKAVGSGGSTGRPKIVLDPLPWVAHPVTARRLGAPAWNGLVDFVKFTETRTQLVPGPLFHNAPFLWCHLGLFMGQKVVVLKKFDADSFLDAVQRHRIEFALVVPTMMRRVMNAVETRSVDLSSLRAVVHTGGACPAEVKKRWTDLVGPEHVYEIFGSNEQVGMACIRGDGWLERPTSVGKPLGSEARIVGDDAEVCPPGVVGEIFMRPFGGVQTYRYIGAPPARTTDDGFVSVGDLGWLDEDGYLHVADRREDMIVSGGVNVYPAEVEAALAAHPAVGDAAVVGVPDDEWGKRVHAFVVPANPRASPEPKELDAHCRRHIAAYKVPKSYEFVAALPRDEFGKLRRSGLSALRQQP